MKTYYYSFRDELTWSERKQYSVQCLNWNDFMFYCKSLSFHFQREIRACESRGYDNQGTYIYSVKEIY